MEHPLFLDWATYPHPETGSTFIEKLNLTWNDPHDKGGDFAAMVNIFQRQLEARVSHGQNGNIWEDLLHRRHPHSAQDYGPLRPLHRPLLAGRFEILKKLGQGGNGEVFLAWSHETESLYGLKTIRKEFWGDPATVRRFKAEVEAWVLLEPHPNIVRAFHFIPTPDALILTMEYLESKDGYGSSLADRLKVQRFTPPQILALLLQVCDGLTHAYTFGVQAHRDLKPGNILISADHVAKVADFGLVSAARHPGRVLRNGVSGDWSGTAPGTALGTPIYMPPEQFVDARVCDQRSDIYALGITLYQTLSGGRPAFLPPMPVRPNARDRAQFMMDLRHAHERQPPPRLESPFWPIVQRCLAKRPDDRFQSILLLREALEDLGRAHGRTVRERVVGKPDLWSARDHGTTLQALGKYEEALLSHNRFLEGFPGEGDASFNKATCLAKMNRHAEAMDIYRWLADDEDIRAVINGSHTLKILGKLDDTLAFSERAVRLAPDDKDSWLALGLARYSLHRFAESAVAYERAATIDSGNATAHYNLGLAHDASGDGAAAVHAWNLFLKLAADDDPRRSSVVARLDKLSGQALGILPSKIPQHSDE